jgi:hypothetical protein
MDVSFVAFPEPDLRQVTHLSVELVDALVSLCAYHTRLSP